MPSMNEGPRPTDSDAAFERRILDLSPLAGEGSAEAQISEIEGVAIDMLLEMDPKDIAAIATEYPKLQRLPGVLDLLREIGKYDYRPSEGDS